MQCSVREIFNSSRLQLSNISSKFYLFLTSVLLSSFVNDFFSRKYKGRRLKKYYLFRNTAFSSLFIMKFVRYIYTYVYDKIHSNVETKKANKIYRKFPIYIGIFRCIYTTKHTLNWNKKSLQNIS